MAAAAAGLVQERRPVSVAEGVALQGSDLLLVCSTGGHLLQLVALRDSFGEFSRTWITFDKTDARSLLSEEQVLFAHGPTNRSIKNLLRNLLLARRVVRSVRPKILVTTGAGVAVPFAWMARLRGIPVVYVESLSRIEGPSLSYRLIAPFAARTYVQWQELADALPRARFAGNVFSASA
jgi:UDP-N-acetylglucosamine:LPS N-acetylglucosamine transferase